MADAFLMNMNEGKSSNSFFAYQFGSPSYTDTHGEIVYKSYEYQNIDVVYGQKYPFYLVSTTGTASTVNPDELDVVFSGRIETPLNYTQRINIGISFRQRASDEKLYQIPVFDSSYELAFSYRINLKGQFTTGVTNEFNVRLEIDLDKDPGAPSGHKRSMWIECSAIMFDRNFIVEA